MVNVVIVVVPVFADLTVEMYLDRLILDLGEPRLTAGEPVIRKFGLPAVDYLLLEIPYS